MNGDDEREKAPIRITSTPEGARRIDVRAPRPAREDKRVSRAPKAPVARQPRTSQRVAPEEAQPARSHRPIPRTAAVPGRTKDGRSSAPPELPATPPPPPTPADDVSAALALVGAPRVRVKDTKKKDKPQTAREALKQRALAQRAPSTRPPQKTQRTEADDDAPVSQPAAERRLAKPPVTIAESLETEAGDAADAHETGGLWRRVKGWFGGAR